MCHDVCWNINKLIVKLSNFTHCLSHFPTQGQMFPRCCVWSAAIDSRRNGVEALELTPYVMDHTTEVKMYLPGRAVDSRSIGSLWISQSPSCELKNQWFSFWQPQSYLAETEGGKHGVKKREVFSSLRVSKDISFLYLLFLFRMTTCQQCQRDK